MSSTVFGLSWTCSFNQAGPDLLTQYISIEKQHPAQRLVLRGLVVALTTRVATFMIPAEAVINRGHAPMCRRQRRRS